MSAFIVDKDTIDILTTALVIQAMQDRNSFDADYMGYCLWDTNRRSVANRYPNDKDGEWPGPIGLTRRTIVDYRFTDKGAGLTPAQVKKALATYVNQSCDFPEWPETSPARWLAHLAAAID